MGDFAEFPLRTQLFLRGYPWRTIDPIPWSPLESPLSRARLALVSTAGFVRRGGEPFQRRGDSSYREIPSEIPVDELVDTHNSDAFDHAPMRSDPNVAFPLDRARELVERGRIGSLAPHHLSFMGSIPAPGRLIRDSAPCAARALRAASVDVALLVPV